VLVQTFAATELGVLPYTCCTGLLSAQLRTTRGNGERCGNCRCRWRRISVSHLKICQLEIENCTAFSLEKIPYKIESDFFASVPSPLARISLFFGESTKRPRLRSAIRSEERHCEPYRLCRTVSAIVHFHVHHRPPGKFRTRVVRFVTK